MRRGFSSIPIKCRQAKAGSAFPHRQPMPQPPPKTPRVSLPEPGPDQELTDQEKLDRMSRQRLMQVAADCGIRFDFGWTKAQLKHAIVEVLNDNGP